MNESAGRLVFVGWGTQPANRPYILEANNNHSINTRSNKELCSVWLSPHEGKTRVENSFRKFFEKSFEKVVRELVREIRSRICSRKFFKKVV